MCGVQEIMTAKIPSSRRKEVYRKSHFIIENCVQVKAILWEIILFLNIDMAYLWATTPRCQRYVTFAVIFA
jgi:hypothetical protein